ncbi:MAG: hypothetical protein KDB61_13835, partial [Planctomycetes bacterium]|nr:hypothetical protein [Planctomycetota bacterium]
MDPRKGTERWAIPLKSALSRYNDARSARTGLPAILFTQIIEIMIAITSWVFLILLGALMLLAIFPERIRNKEAFRRGLVACLSVIVVQGLGLGLLAVAGFSGGFLFEIRGVEDLSKFAIIGLLGAAQWLAI